MRNISILFFLIFGILILTGISSCGGGGSSSGGFGTLIADFDLEGDEYLAVPRTPFGRFLAMFAPRAANALPDLGFDSNSFPFNHFTGDKPAQAGVHVLITAPDQSFIAQGQIGLNGRVQFTELPTGFLTMVITGQDGHNYYVPIQIAKEITSRSLVLVFRNYVSGRTELSAKTIHDVDGDGINDDQFSYAIFNRPRNASTGGTVHLHVFSETKVDENGDGDFTDADDYTVVEPDDDGVGTNDGDGDEDNDGKTDNVDEDIDGDDILNNQDDDIDGDGIPNGSDQYPDGITPDDDFTPPTLTGSLFYSGIMDISKLDETTVSVFFPTAIDENPPVVYNIYYSTESPIDFDTASMQKFQPTPGSPDEIKSDNVTGLVTGQTYYFAVRAMDSAQPPNEDQNTEEMEITLVPD